MSYAADMLRVGVRRVLIGQAILTVLTSAVCALAFGSPAALAAAYGGGVALIGTWLLARRVQRTPESTPGAGSGQLTLYAGILPRYIVMLALFALGIGGLKLLPLALIAGFALAQLGFLINLTNILQYPASTRKHE